MNWEMKKKFLRMMYVFDLNQKGFLDQRDFITGIQRASPEIDETKAKQIYNEVDDNQNKFIEFDELIFSFVSDEDIMKTENLKNIFYSLVEDKQFFEMKSKLSDLFMSVETLR